MVQGLFLEYAIMRSKRSSNRLVAPFREINKERERKKTIASSFSFLDEKFLYRVESFPKRGRGGGGGLYRRSCVRARENNPSRVTHE